MRARLREPLTWIVVAFAIAVLAGCWWNLPCTDAWSNDEVSPRASALGAVFETWIPGHFFRYPPLHVLLLTVLQSPLIVIAGLRAGWSQDALATELIFPGYMTAAAVIGRLVALLMACGIVRNVHALWARLSSPRAGSLAAAFVASSPILVYFAHTASVDVPYWFWTTWAMVELDRVAAGEGREVRALALCAAAVLTKDQSAFLLAGAFSMSGLLAPALLAPAGRRLRSLVRPALLKGLAVAAVAELVASGAITNPSGFRQKLAFMTGEGNKGWTLYARTAQGAAEQLRDIALQVPTLGSAAVAAVAAVGVGLAFAGRDRPMIARRLAPLAAAIGYLVLFVVPSRWTMERHLFPLLLMLFPYAALAIDRAIGRLPKLRAPLLAGAGIALLPSLLDVASVDATLIADPRNQVSELLGRLAPGTRVEVYGGNQYLPHLPRGLSVTRVGPESFDARSPLPGVVELKAPFLAINERAPEYVVTSAAFARLYMPRGERRTDRDRALGDDPDGRGLFEGLSAGSLGYRWALRAECKLPWPLTCKRIHLSTGEGSWVFVRDVNIEKGAPL